MEHYMTDRFHAELLSPKKDTVALQRSVRAMVGKILRTDDEDNERVAEKSCRESQA